MGVIAVVILLPIAWIVCAIAAYSDRTLGMLLLWSIPIPGVMVPMMIWMRWRYNDRVHIWAPPRPHRSPHQGRRQQQAALRSLPRSDATSDPDRPLLILAVEAEFRQLRFWQLNPGVADTWLRLGPGIDDNLVLRLT